MHTTSSDYLPTPILPTIPLVHPPNVILHLYLPFSFLHRFISVPIIIPVVIETASIDPPARCII